MVTEAFSGIVEHSQKCGLPIHFCWVFNPKPGITRCAVEHLMRVSAPSPTHATSVCLRDEIGYIKAANIGWKLLDPKPNDYICLLNDDVEVTGDFLTPMIGALFQGASQVGPSVHPVGRDGFWGKGDEPYAFVEGWCFLALARTIRRAAACVNMAPELLYDESYQGGYCEDVDLSIRIQKIGGTIKQVENIPLRHLRSQTYGSNREPFWTRNRELLIQRWHLNEM